MTDLETMFGPMPATPATQALPVGEKPGDGEPVGVEQVLTPSGLEIYYQSGPKRLYKLNGIEVPSVSEVLDVLEKPGLTWWGMKVGIQGMFALLERNLLWTDSTWGEDKRFTPGDGRGRYTVDDIITNLTQQKLTVNHVRDKAGDRGTSVHKAFETWAEKEILPEPEMWPEEERGYVQGLRSFLEDSKIVPHRSEVMVGSADYGYAGRFDLHAWWTGHEVCTHLTPKGRGDKRSVIAPGFCMLDLKTSKGVYPLKHYRQLAAYELAAQESGYERTDFQAVVRVSADGRYEVKQSTAGFSDFEAVLGVWETNRKLKHA